MTKYECLPPYTPFPNHKMVFAWHTRYYGWDYLWPNVAVRLWCHNLCQPTLRGKDLVSPLTQDQALSLAKPPALAGKVVITHPVKWLCGRPWRAHQHCFLIWCRGLQDPVCSHSGPDHSSLVPLSMLPPTSLAGSPVFQQARNTCEKEPLLLRQYLEKSL